MTGLRNFRESLAVGGTRELESAIRAAYVRKEQEAQVREAEASRLAAAARERLRNKSEQIWLAEWDAASAETLRKEREAKIRYGNELLEAVSSRELRKSALLDAEKRERKILEEVSRVMEETRESLRMREKLDLAARKSRELLIFREIREIREQREAEAEEEARKRESEYAEETERRLAELVRTRIERAAERESVIEKVSRSLLEMREGKLAIAAMLEDLAVEEKLFEEEVRLREAAERRKAVREEAAVEFQRHQRVMEERRLRHEIEEEEFAAEVMRRVLEDARTERLTVEARRRKRREYREALESIIAERRRGRAEEMRRLEETLRDERARGVAEEKRARETRRRLLLRHAGNVAEFIAGATLSDEERRLVQEAIVEKKIESGTEREMGFCVP